MKEISQTRHRQAHNALPVLEDKSEPLALRQAPERFCEGINLPDALYVESVF
jgi:hypothetical protein